MICKHINMNSMMYALYRIIKNENGTIIDGEIIEANQKYCDYYHVEGDPTGKRRSEVLPKSKNFANEMMHRALETRKTQVCSYVEDNLGELSVVFEPVGDDTVGICTFDAAMANHQQIRKDQQARINALCFLLMDGIIWRWDVQKQECYSNDAMFIRDFELNGLRVDDETGLLVWSFEGMTNSIYEEDRDEFDRIVKNYLNDPKGRLQHTFRMKTPNGLQQVDLRVCIEDFDADGKPNKFIGVTRFI